MLLKLVGLNPVAVHGGGPQIDTALSKLIKKGTFIQGIRVTDKETMDNRRVGCWAAEVQQDIVGLDQFRRRQGRASRASTAA